MILKRLVQHVMECKSSDNWLQEFKPAVLTIHYNALMGLRKITELEQINSLNG